MDKLNITNITAKRESLSDINIFRAQQNRDDDIDRFAANGCERLQVGRK